MPSLLEELKNDQRVSGTSCSLCQWLDTLTPETRTEWDAALDDRAYSHASIYRALDRREAHVGRSSVKLHRANKHRRAS